MSEGQYRACEALLDRIQAYAKHGDISLSEEVLHLAKAYREIADARHPQKPRTKK